MAWIKNNWVSILAITLSITALFRCDPFKLSESGLIWVIGVSTAVLGVAITAAVAIQVYNSVVSEAKIKVFLSEEILKNKEFIEKKIEESRQEFLSLLYVTQSQRSFIEKDYEDALDILMRALVHANVCNDRTAYNTVVEAINILIKTINERNIEFSIELPSQLWYKDVVSKIENKHIVNIEKFIDTVKTRDPAMPKEIDEMLEPYKKQPTS